MTEETEIQQLPIQKEKPSLAKTIVKNSIYNAATNAVNRIGALIFTIIIARLLNPEGFGLYNLTISIALVLITFADVGINQALIRYLAIAFGKRNNQLAASYAKYLFKIKLILAFLTSLVLFLFASLISRYIFHKPELIYPLMVAAAYIFILAFMGFFESFFYASQKIKIITFKEAILQASRILFSLLLIGLVVEIQLKVAMVIIATTIATIIAIIILVCFLYLKQSFFFQKAKPLNNLERKRVNKFLYSLAILGISGIFFAYIDTIMLGVFVDSAYIGLYRAAFAIIITLASLLSISNVLLPIFTQLERKRLSEAFQKSLRYSFMITIPAAIGVILVAKPFINIIYGKDYLLATIPLFVLSVLVVEMGTGTLFSTVFSAREKPQIPARILVIATIMNILLNYLFIKLFLPLGQIYATLGVGLATVISRYFNFIMLAIAAKKEFNVSIDSISIVRPLFASLIMAIALIIFQQTTNLVWPVSIIEIIFGAIIYLVIMLLIKGIKKEDFELIKLLKSK